MISPGFRAGRWHDGAVRASRLAVVWTAVTLGLLALATGLGVWGALHAADARERTLARLSATARSTVVSPALTEHGTVTRVVFEDATGAEHLLVVRADDLPEGTVDLFGGADELLVRYDPQHPDHAMVAAAADRAAPDHRTVTLVLALLALVPLLGWTLRWLGFARAGAAPAQLLAVQALVADDDPDERTPLRWWHGLRRRTWLRIAPAAGGRGADVRYQRVLWDPRLARLRDGAVVTVRRRSPDGRSVVSVDGVAVLPLGPSRRRPPVGVLRAAVVQPFTWQGVVRPALPLVASVVLELVRAFGEQVLREGLPGTAGLPLLGVLVALLASGWTWSGPVPLLDRPRLGAPVRG